VVRRPLKHEGGRRRVQYKVWRINGRFIWMLLWQDLHNVTACYNKSAIRIAACIIANVQRCL